jgi:hypothetical protein
MQGRCALDEHDKEDVSLLLSGLSLMLGSIQLAILFMLYILLLIRQYPRFIKKRSLLWALILVKGDAFCETFLLTEFPKVVQAI